MFTPDVVLCKYFVSHSGLECLIQKANCTLHIDKGRWTYMLESDPFITAMPQAVLSQAKTRYKLSTLPFRFLE